MNHILRNKTKGKILFVEGRHIYKAINGILLHSSNNGNSWEEIQKVQGDAFLEKFIYFSHLACRLFRKGIHHFNIQSENKYAILFDKNIKIVNNGNLVKQVPIKGSRPLSFEFINQEFVYGEYRSNLERSDIGIFGFNVNGELHNRATMAGIRHIHGVYQDAYTGLVWITTGDENNEAAIYCTDIEFKSIEKILYGSQQIRTIKLLFDENYIYFGSDAPNETNYLYRMEKNLYKVEKLTKVGSSVFHGCKLKNWFFFSTAIEPSMVNKTKYAELWASPNGTEWSRIMKFKKDFFSMRYFQYGQIFFPNGKGNDEDLWISLLATKYTNQSFRVSLDEVEALFFKNRSL